MKTSRVLAALAALLLPLVAVVAAPSATAAGASVTVANMAFTPASVKVGLGESVTWTFQDVTAHTATSDVGFFNTGPASGGVSRTVRFPSAGKFGYHCTFHPMMVGKVIVPMAATGSVKDGWKVRWLAGINPKNRSYDVQVRRVGTKTWRVFRHGTTTASGRFDPGSGSWQARARTVKGNAKSGWSPMLRLP
jgi:plastocyanin